MKSFMGVLFGIGILGTTQALITHTVTNMTLIGILCLWAVGLFTLVDGEMQ